MTDRLSPNNQFYNRTLEESNKYGDLFFQKVAGGVTFGFRFISHMVFAVSRFHFDYFLRVDDDYFLCFDKLLDEIPLPPLKRFHWGWVHCDNKDIIRPEESVILLSRDIIEMFLLQDPKRMLCHPLADQMLGLWSNVINLNRSWHHDKRLWHHPPARDVKWIINSKNICHHYIGLHGSYPKNMISFWNNRGNYNKTVGNLASNSDICPINNPFRWDLFYTKWRYEPKLCITNPTWDTSILSVKDGSYIGREG